jgi:hypothetical protein
VPSKPPPPPPQSGLDEVERALSVLGGRHPEHEKTRRETAEAARHRSGELARELAANARTRRRRAIVLGTNGVALLAAGVVAWRLTARAHTIHDGLERAEAPWAGRGFVEIATNAVTASNTLESDLEGPSCFAAVSTGDGPLRAHEDTMAVEALHSVAWCTCGPGRAKIEATATTGVTGLAILRADARLLGGPLARGWLDYAPGAWGASGGDCADAVLDDWIADRKGHPPVIDDAWLDADPSRASLRRAGFRVVAMANASRPFAVVEAAAGDCLLAIAGPADALSLRARGGAWLVRHAQRALAWCGSRAATETVWREGASPVVVLSAPAVRIGGLLGARECADVAGVRIASSAAWIGEDDLAWDATALLRASAPGDVSVDPLPAVPGAPDRRVASLVLSSSATVASDPASVAVACDPPLDVDAGSRETVCAHSAPVAWWRKGDAPAFAAHAALPQWLSVLGTRTEPDAIARVPELLSLARRLKRDGFEPTTLEGVTELPDGVRVIGRAGEDAVVAVGLGPKAPWTFPYTDHVPWDLGDTPVSVAIKPGESVKLTASPAPNAPEDKRRTVVFRHAVLP